jgi:hypothetical protein
MAVAMQSYGLFVIHEAGDAVVRLREQRILRFRWKLSISRYVQRKKRTETG